MPAPTHVQTSSEVSVAAAASGQVTLTGVGAGNLLVVVLSQTASATRVYSGSDDRGDTWASAEQLNPGLAAAILYAANVAGGDTIVTVSVNIGTATFRFKVLEFSGAATASVLDVTSELSESSASNSHVCAATADVIDTVANVLVVCAALTSAAVTSTAEGGGYTKVTSANATILWQFKTSAGALTNEQGAWTHVGTARTGISVIASFKAPAEGGTDSYSGRGVGRGIARGVMR